MKQSKIVQPGDYEPIQLNLFEPTGVSKVTGLNPFPEVLRTDEGFKRVLERANGTLGLDFEFNPSTKKPTVLGIAVRDLACAIPWKPELALRAINWCQQNNIKIIGHSVVGADKPVLEKALGIKTSLDLWDDSMVKHYILNQDFCKAVDKEDDEGSLGFMNLWVCASMYTDAYQWKICRGRACEGPCPRHNVWEYCAIDAWASVESGYAQDKELARRGVPQVFYRELMELSEICDKMETQGVRINIPYIEKLSAEMEEMKDKIFEYEQVGKNRVYKDFNPKSPDQIIEWFGARGLSLKKTDIKYIEKQLEKQAHKNDFSELKEYIQYLDEKNGTDNEVTRNLWKLHTFKGSGKGTDAWFSEKYRNNDFIHPRFIVTGTSSGRLASSRPNFQNIPVRGWAVIKNSDGSENHRIKTAIIPRNESLDFLESDFSQLELRDVLYLSGVDPSVAGKDAFTWLVQQGAGLFEKAAEGIPMLRGAEDPGRDAAKSMSHAGNYMEGIELLTGADLMKPNVRRQIANGALRVYSKKYMPQLKKDWEYCGYVVGFNGKNLAQRFFGDQSEENRKKALEIQEDVYFAKFPMIREWQMKVLDQIESCGYVTSPTGRFLKLYGSARDNAKVGVATLGQGVGADHMGAVMIKFYREFGVIADLTVHDSLLFGIPKEWSDKKAYEFIEPMYAETWRLPGFKCPGKPKRGPTYGELRKLNV